MKTIRKIYRDTYDGENVVTDMTFSGGSWELTQEMVPNLVTNTQISNNAVIIGNGTHRQGLDLNLIKNHKGGLLASGALQSYGCNALYRDFTPHFLVANGAGIIAEIANSGYADNNIVYSHADAILDHPGKFYLIPQDPGWDAGATAASIACFDGHRKVFLLGFDGFDTLDMGYRIYQGTNGYDEPSYGYSGEYFGRTMLEVFKTYDNVDFVLVAPTDTYAVAEAWKYMPNFRQIDFNGFALEADLG